MTLPFFGLPMRAAVNQPTITGLWDSILDTSNGTSYAAAGGVAPSSGYMVALVTVSATSDPGAAPTITGHGLTWAIQRTGVFNSTWRYYLCTAPVTGSPTTAAFTISGLGSSTGCYADVLNSANAQSIVQTGAAVAAGPSNPAVTGLAAMNVNGCYAAMCANPSTTTPGVPTSWTQRNTGNVTLPTHTGISAARNQNESGTSVTFTGTTVSNWACMAIELG